MINIKGCVINIELEPVVLKTDILIIGGGTAGCYAVIIIAENSNAKGMGMMGGMGMH